MTEGTAEDWGVIAHHNLSSPPGCPTGCSPTCGCSTATSAASPSTASSTPCRRRRAPTAAGEDDEYVVCALLHDIGDTLGSYNHADIAAAILKPFVSEENHWMVEKHAIFQGYYFFHHLGLDRDMRDQYRGHPCYDRTATFCHEYDQPAFDPSYETLPLEHFEPAVREVLGRPPPQHLHA